LKNYADRYSRLFTELAKVLRKVTTRKPIKLNLSGLVVQKQDLEAVLQALKTNSPSFVQELNLSKNLLDERDLEKLRDLLG